MNKKEYRIKTDNNLFFYPREWLKIMAMAKQKQIITFEKLINTGARYNEAANICPMDVDFERKSITLRITKVKAKLKETRPRPRIIPISSQFCKKLKKWQRDYKIADDQPYPTLTNKAIGVALKKYSHKIGRKDWQDISTHNLRKTFENWLLAIGVPEFKVLKHLGHTEKVALRHYLTTDTSTDDDRMIIRQILGDLYHRRSNDW